MDSGGETSIVLAQRARSTTHASLTLAAPFASCVRAACRRERSYDAACCCLRRQRARARGPQPVEQDAQVALVVAVARGGRGDEEAEVLGAHVGPHDPGLLGAGEDLVGDPGDALLALHELGLVDEPRVDRL